MAPSRGSLRPQSVQERAFAMHAAGSSIEEICDRFDHTKEEVRKMLYRARKQRQRMQEAAE